MRRRDDERPRAVVTIGVFDGVHRGHRVLVDRVLEHARRLDARSSVITFSRHPLAVLDPVRCPPSLTTADERQRLLEATAIEDVHTVDFDENTANMSASAFLDSVVWSRYRLLVLVAGPDFAMGRDRRGDLGRLAALGEERGFELDAVAALPVGGAPVSSSRIRTLVETGDMTGAAELLGRPYAVAGVVETGDGRGRTIGFPTANLAVPETKLLPANGVYACSVVRGDHGAHPAVVNIGVAPTFGGARRRVEAHLLDWRGDLLGVSLEVSIIDRLRAERRFSGVDELRSQIESDVEEARRRLAAAGVVAGRRGADPSE